MSPLARIAQAAAHLVAGQAETRVALLGSSTEAYRAGWTWPEGLRALEELRTRLAPASVLLGWEGGICAFRPEDPDSPVLAPAPGTRGRAHCPGVGLLGAILAEGGPALDDLPDGQALRLPPPEDLSAHARLAWSRHLPKAPPLHPLTAQGILLRRAGPLVAAFAPKDPWPLALRRLDR